MNDDLGKLILRLTLGVLLLFHGVAKLAGGVGPISGMLGNAGMPGQLAYLVYIGEVLAPILLIIGLWTRAAALIVVINMIVAVVLVHTAELMQITKTGGWALELQGFFFFVALALMFLGAGQYSVGGRGGKWN